MRKIWKSLRNGAGQGLVEYALILLLLVIVVVAALTTFGEKTSNTVNDLAEVWP